MSPPASDYKGQVDFLLKVQQLLTEGGFVATYKYALLHAIADLCIERDSAKDGSLTLTVDELAGKFIELYWPQVHHFPVRDEDDLVLMQNTGQQAAVVNAVREYHRPYQGRLSGLKVDPAAWRRAVRRVGRTIQKMPLWKLQTVGSRPVEFLYRNDLGADRIALFPGVPDCFRAFHGLLIELVRAAWIRFIRRHNDAVRDSLELYGFLFGTERAHLEDARNAIERVSGMRCFYCDSRIARRPEVDHFIPWARYPNDLGHNFVLAHPSCNNRKSDFLAAEEHLERWVDRNQKQASPLADAFADLGIDHDSESSIRIARWAYDQVESAGGEVWVRGKEFCLLGPGWRSVLG